MKAAFLDFDSLGPADLDTSTLRAALPGIELFPSSAGPEIEQRIAGKEILLVNKVRLDRRRLQSVPELRLVCLAATGTKDAPWYVVPADDKRNARLIVSKILLDTLDGLKMQYPQVDEARLQEFQTIRAHLVD